MAGEALGRGATTLARQLVSDRGRAALVVAYTDNVDSAHVNPHPHRIVSHLA